MQNEEMVPANEFCIHHNIELSFLDSLKDYGMIETVLVDEKMFLPLSQLTRLEKIILFHFELDINLEGIETIVHLLERMEGMQNQIQHLTNLLKVHEKVGQNTD